LSARQPAQPVKLRWIFVIWLALLVLMAAAIGATIWYQKRHPLWPYGSASATSSLLTCGPVRLHEITLIYRDGRAPEDRQVATFFPWGCPDDDKADCKFRDADQAYPDPVCTPGAIYDLTGNTDPAAYDERRNQAIICETNANAKRGSKDRRDVDRRTDRWIWQRYDRTRPSRGGETDHYMPVGLDGSNETANLLAQTEAGLYDANEKERVESLVVNQIRDQCDGQYNDAFMTLTHAHCIMHNWAFYYDELRAKRIAPSGRGWHTGPC
jgi:hypothetical protein